jgi:2',3'-cyclic-nucleotide 2'-phosphodiesterase (5'-nucleotidase family)
VKVIRFAAVLVLLLFVLNDTVWAAYQPSDFIGNYKGKYAALQKSSQGSSESPLGDVVADAVRIATGADLALINSGDLMNDLPQGAVHWQDITEVFSDNRLLSLTIISPAELKKILEISVSHIQVIASTEKIDEIASEFKGFCQVSGFSFKYDASAPVDQRIMTVTLLNGSQVDLKDDQKQLTLAATSYMLSGGYEYPKLDEVSQLEIGLADALAKYVEAGNISNLDENERIAVLGARKNLITSTIPPELILAGSAIIIVIFLVSFRKKVK